MHFSDRDLKPHQTIHYPRTRVWYGYNTQNQSKSLFSKPKHFILGENNPYKEVIIYQLIYLFNFHSVCIVLRS
jgi:hypothetical protein